MPIRGSDVRCTPRACILVLGPEIGLAATLAVLAGRQVCVHGASSSRHAVSCLHRGPDLAIVEMVQRESAAVVAMLRRRPRTRVILTGDHGRAASPLGRPVGVPAPLASIRHGPGLSQWVTAAFSPIEHPRVCDAVEFIRHHHAGRLPVSSVAREAGVTPTRLVHVFHRATGMTVKDWIARVKVEAAKRMLGETDLKLEAIAERLGFSHASHLSRVFLRHRGESPGAYRRSLRLNGPCPLVRAAACSRNVQETAGSCIDGDARTPPR